MYKSCSYCYNSCWKNPIFYKFLLKKNFQKKIFLRKKSKNQNWSIFDFSLIGSSVFELEPKTAKLRKQVELCPQGCFYLLSKEDLFSRGGAPLTGKGGTGLVLTCRNFYRLHAIQIFCFGVNDLEYLFTPTTIVWNGVNDLEYLLDESSMMTHQAQTSGSF